MSAAPFRMRVVTVPPGAERVYLEDEWRDALVVLQEGDIDLVALSGVRRSFHPGAILWLEGLPLRSLQNPGAEPARLLAVSRRGRSLRWAGDA